MYIYITGTQQKDKYSLEVLNKKISVKLDDEDVKIIRKIIFGEIKEGKRYDKWRIQKIIFK